MPAAHYTCSGVTTNLDGRIVLALAGRHYCNLYTANKAARMGLHGGNQLASTSLLKGLVFGSSMGKAAAGANGPSAAAADCTCHTVERGLAMTILAAGLALSSPPLSCGSKGAVPAEATTILT